MKKEYISPELSEIQFDTEDVLTHSIIAPDGSKEDEYGQLPFNW